MQIFKVGGAVRDRLLGRPVTEVDWVVVGASAEEMLAKGYKPVGADFPVFLHPKTGDEYALARTERKSGRGYGGFTFFASPEVTLEEDLIRRDLTINAIAEDQNGVLTDPYHGQRDLQNKLLRHVSPAFSEDPLRVLRVARFAARYAPLGFTVAPETMALMRHLSESGELQALTAERSWKETSRALMEPRPDVFVEVLRESGALQEILPEVATLFSASIGIGQHMLAVLRQCAHHELPLTVRWAALLCDVSKGGLELIAAVNARCKVPRDCQELAMLVGEFHTQGQRALELEPSALFELLQRFDVYRRPQRFEEFIACCEMNAKARPDSEGSGYPQADYLRGAAKAAREVNVKPLIESGLKGLELGNALSEERLKALQTYKTL